MSRSNHLGRLPACLTLVIALLAALQTAPQPAAATPPAEVIVEDVSIDSYIHYHQDLLYTFMGDNRGFGPEHDLARDNILAEFAAQEGLLAELDPFTYNSQTYNNVVATQTGTDFPDEIFIVGAHMDSVNNPGADDNATGTALVMEAARVLSKYRSPRTIKYCAFDREEQGLHGSTAFVADHAGQNIVMAVTIDMVGHNGSGLYAMDLYGKPASSDVINGVADAIDSYGQGLGTFLNFGNFAFSDHWPFEVAGIPAVVAIERCFQCNPHYHQQTDAVDNPSFPNGDYIDYTMPENLARAYVGYLVEQIGITLWNDADNDADIDFADFAALQRCVGQPATIGCTPFDRNADGQITLADYEDYLDALTGPTGDQTAALPPAGGDYDASAFSIPQEVIERRESRDDAPGNVFEIVPGEPIVDFCMDHFHK